MRNYIRLLSGPFVSILIGIVFVLLGPGRLRSAESDVPPVHRKTAEEFMDLVIHPEKPLDAYRVDERYQISVLRNLFVDFSRRMARWEGRNLFDPSGNALRCGKLVEVTKYQEEKSFDGISNYTVQCFCRMQNAGVIVQFGFGPVVPGSPAFKQVRVVRDPARPMPESMPEKGYFRRTGHYSDLFDALTSPPSETTPESETTTEPEKIEKGFRPDPALPRQRRLAEQLMHEILHSKRKFTGIFGMSGMLVGDWVQRRYYLENLFAKFSGDMARYGGKNISDEYGNAYRCGKFVDVIAYEDYTHFDGTEMIQCTCRFEYAGIRVRLAFDEKSDNISAIWVLPEPGAPTPEFFPKNGYHENIDPVPIPGRKHRLMIDVVRKDPESGKEEPAECSVLFLKQADEALKQPHLWIGETERWQDPATGKFWEQFEPSLNVENPLVTWKNGVYSSMSHQHYWVTRTRCTWSHLPPGEYRIAVVHRIPSDTLPADYLPEIRFTTFFSEPVTIQPDSPKDMEQTVIIPEGEARNLVFRDAETGSDFAGKYSVGIKPGFPFPLHWNFFAYLMVKEGRPLRLQGLEKGKYVLEVRKIPDSFLSERRMPYRFEFDTEKDREDWIISLPQPHEGAPVQKQRGNVQ